MTESYCSYEVSKLLKKKGFDEPCRSYFIDNVDYIDTSYSTEELTDLNMGVWETLRPTHQMVCAWLREVYNIDIIIFHEKLLNDYYWARIERNLFTEIQQEPEYNSYEEAVESAIKYCLENLIK